MKEITREPNLPAPTNCFGKEQPMATWYECPHCGRTSPLTRQWVNLADEDIAELHNEWAQGNLWDGWNYERAIEAKLREKNNG